MKRLLIFLLILFLCSTSFGWQKPMLGQQINQANPLSKGVVGYWVMNEGGGNKIFDLSGNKRDGILQADAYFVFDKFGSCLSLDGTGDCVNLPNGAVFSYSNFTLSHWVCRKGKGGSYQQSIGLTNKYYFDIAETYINFKVKNASTWYTATFAISPTNIWYHVVGVFDGTTVSLYINGDFKNSADFSGTYTPTATAPYMGSYDGSVYFYYGLIDNVIFYNRALTAKEIRQLYQDPFAMFEWPSIYLYYSPPEGGVMLPYYYLSGTN